ncbi:MAG: PepSY-associated TM helix domain-containing protein [Gemmatimonadota bacterium]
MKFREFLVVTHRWIGLGAAIVLLAAGATGAVLVWVQHTDGDTLTRLHTRLLIGEPGEWLVITSTIAAVLLAIGGVILWWRRKIFALRRGRSAWRTWFDLHHAVGIFGTIVMLLIAASGLGLVLTEEEGEEEGSRPVETAPEVVDPVRRLVYDLHTGSPYPLPVKIVYALGSLAFVMQSISGYKMWRKPAAERDQA